MTAFTYRFAPSLRYLTHLAKSGKLGDLRHFRSQRFQDFPETSWGWRQYKATAGAGHVYDMTSHRSAFRLPHSFLFLPPVAYRCSTAASVSGEAKWAVLG